MYAPHPPSPSSPCCLVIVCLGQLRSLDVVLRESTARRDVRYTSAACSVCCTENSFPQHRPAPLTAPPGSQNFQTSYDSHNAIQGRSAPHCLAVCGLELDCTRRERPTFAERPPHRRQSRALSRPSHLNGSKAA